LLLHIDAPVCKSLLGEDIFYFDNLNPQDSESDKVFSLKELSIVNRKIIIISENAMQVTNFSNDSIFVFLPLKSSFWMHNPILSLYSIEFLLYDFYKRKSKKLSQKGKIENIIRIQAQTYLKFLSKIISSAFESVNCKYKWINECPIGRMLLSNYLMYYYFLSWLEFERKGTYLDIPIKHILPQELITANFRIYEFLKTMTGTDLDRN
jgi:hypothetical protein